MAPKARQRAAAAPAAAPDTAEPGRGGSSRKSSGGTSKLVAAAACGGVSLLALACLVYLSGSPSAAKASTSTTTSTSHEEASEDSSKQMKDLSEVRSSKAKKEKRKVSQAAAWQSKVGILVETWRAQPNVTFLSQDPFIVQFENFLTDSEMDHIVRIATPRLEQSTTGLGYNKELNSRTSRSGWLNAKEDLDDTILEGINERLEELTQIPRKNMEPFQTLKYEKGQYYTKHHDLERGQGAQPCGVRVATFFMYLNDVTKGGGTHFPRLKLEVRPRRGRAILWWNVNFTGLLKGKTPKALGPDLRLEHAALPVEEGEKWAVNRWIHEKDFLTPYFDGRLR
eukprot:gnl/TRDRNA2_/TRDRNA2_174419_c0_seq1.p1 gnl/TRDRNA2_/TRDRNA2_174419_c0~~gnl/TRDRNA2_/TRDRNA2_174419_c0_seq1.p1  ORF type:complete len:339 (+),score=64.19 gnl/TRDRNA2_/TRDRNA2_174419_c0_seq1:92-1108(+)